MVGRYNGFYPRSMEADIVTAIKKSAPTFVLAGTGLPGGKPGSSATAGSFRPGISLWAGDCFEIFAGVERQPSARLRRAGLAGLAGFWRRPWRAVLVFPHLWYSLLLLVHRVFNR